MGVTTPHNSTALITAVVNQKGGVGKTTTTINVGGALAARGYKVLLVDLDPQGHLTDALKLVGQAPAASLANALLGKPDGEPADLIINHSEVNGGRLDVIPTSLDMFTIGPDMYQLRAREERLARVLAPLAPDYDHILVDCPPSLDTLTDNALTAAHGAVMPVQVEDSTIRALRLLLAQIQAVEEDLRDQPLTLHGMLISMLDRGPGHQPRSTIGKSVLAQLEKLPIPILASVPRGVPVAEAWRFGTSVADYAPDSEHAAAFDAVAEVLEKAAA